MSVIDEIAEKRKSIATDKSIRANHDDSIAAVSTSGENTVKATNKLAEHLDKLDPSDFNDAQIKLLTALQDKLDIYNKQLSKNTVNTNESNEQLLKAVTALKMNPTINVPEPSVTVSPPNITVKPTPVNLKPLEDILTKYLKSVKRAEPKVIVTPPITTPVEREEVVDLDSYKAQDINNSNKNLQYVGFVNPEGKWYIIENDIKGNHLRYIFGNSDYKKAFEQAAQYKYLLLDEAIHALSA